jgi:hypothetical protein
MHEYGIEQDFKRVLRRDLPSVLATPAVSVSDRNRETDGGNCTGICDCRTDCGIICDHLQHETLLAAVSVASLSSCCLRRHRCDGCDEAFCFIAFCNYPTVTGTATLRSRQSLVTGTEDNITSHNTQLWGFAIWTTFNDGATLVACARDLADMRLNLNPTQRTFEHANFLIAGICPKSQSSTASSNLADIGREGIANPAHSLNQPGRVRLGFYFLSKPDNQGVDRTIVR